MLLLFRITMAGSLCGIPPASIHAHWLQLQHEHNEDTVDQKARRKTIHRLKSMASIKCYFYFRLLGYYEHVSHYRLVISHFNTYLLILKAIDCLTSRNDGAKMQVSGILKIYSSIRDVFHNEDLCDRFLDVCFVAVLSFLDPYIRL